MPFSALQNILNIKEIFSVYNYLTMCTIFAVSLNHLKGSSRRKQIDNGTGRSRALRRGDPRPDRARARQKERIVPAGNKIDLTQP